MSLSLLSKLNKIRKNKEYMNLTDDIRKNIIIVIFIISLYIILFISDIICIYFDDIKDYFSSLKFKPFCLFNFLEIVFIIIIFCLFPYEKYYKSNYFNEILIKEYLNNTYNISETEYNILEKSYKVPRRINRTILSFSIIILVIFVVKFIRFIYENYCDDEESKNCVSIFNCIIMFFLLMNLFFGFILISKINKIKNNENINIFYIKLMKF